MKTSPRGIDLIKRFEGARLKAYPDPATGGEPWTIGYGITSAAGLGKIAKGMKITLEQADDMLIAALAKYELAVIKALDRSPNQNQFDAMVSLCWNIGPGNFAKSTICKAFNAGDLLRAAGAFLMWKKANGKVLRGLIRRREAERKLFLSA